MLVGFTFTLPLYPQFDFRFPVTQSSQQWGGGRGGLRGRGRGGGEREEERISRQLFENGFWAWGFVSPHAAHDQVIPFTDCSVTHFRRWPGSGCPCTHRPVEQRAVGHAGVPARGGRGSGVCCRRAGGAWGLHEPWKLPGPTSGEVRPDPRPCTISMLLCTARKMRAQTQLPLNQASRRHDHHFSIGDGRKISV